MIPRRDRRSLVGEMDDLYAQRVSKRGRLRALAWYGLEIVSFAARLSTTSATGRGRSRRLHACPARRAGRIVSAMGSDLRLASRRLLRSPGYTLAVVATLGVGVGGIVTVYAAASWVLLRPVPGLQEPERMRWIHLVNESGAPMPVSHLDLLDLGRRVPALDGITASREVDVHARVSSRGAPERLTGELVPASYFNVMRLRGVTGRTFDLSEHAGSTVPLEVVVSHALAERLWSSRDAALGQRLGVNGHGFTVIGVTPRGFRGAELTGRASLWLPAGAIGFVQPTGPGPDRALSRRYPGIWTDLYGRVDVDVPTDVIAAQLADVAASIADAEAMSSFMLGDTRFDVTPGLGLRPGVRAVVQRTLVLLGGASAFLLLLCMANVTNLTLARHASASASVAVRRALGASRLRVTAHLLAENVVLGAGGALVAVGTAVAVRATFGGARLSSVGANLEGMRLEGDVVGGAALAALAVSLATGLLPTLAVGRSVRLLAPSISAHRHDRTGARLRGALVVAQVAVSTVLLVGTGLVLQTVANLRAVDVGLDIERLAVVSLEPGLQGYDAAATERQMEALEARLTEEPGVLAAGSIHPAPFQGWGVNWAIRWPDADGGETRLRALRFKVSPGFLAAAGLQLLAGDGFDVLSNEPADVVINERMARALFPGVSLAETVGREIPDGGFGLETVRIVGVVEDARLVSVHEPPPPIVFHRWSAGLQLGALTTYVRFAGPPRDALAAMRTAAADAAPGIPAFDLRTARGQIDELLAEQRTLARLGFVLAALGTLLAALGLYGTLACAVSERTREIGIRIALGAHSGRLIGAVIGRGMLLVAIGVLIGLSGTLIINPTLESRLFGVTPFDPATYAIGLGLLVVLTVLASALTARRATCVDAVEALRRD